MVSEGAVLFILLGLRFLSSEFLNLAGQNLDHQPKDDRRQNDLLSLFLNHANEAKVNLLWLMCLELSHCVLEELKSAHDFVELVETALNLTKAALVLDLRFLWLYDQGLRYLNYFNLKIISFH